MNPGSYGGWQTVPRLSRWGCCALAAVFPALLPAADEHPGFPKPDQQVLNVYWTDTAPQIDGKIDDACWQDAAIARDFSLFKFAGRPTQATEVRVTYDAENLYLFWTLAEANLDKLVPGGAEDARDFISFEDAGELFLDPGKTAKDYFQLVATPLAARYDSSTRAGEPGNFTPDWKCASGRLPGGWTLEQKIPFGELVSAGCLFATPQVGERWGIQFCRDQGSLHEWSQWVPTAMGFHEPANFGSLYFRGRRTGPQPPPVTKIGAGDLFYGPGVLALTLPEPVQGLTGVCRIEHEQKTLAEVPVRIAGDGRQAEFPYHLLAAGNYRLKFELSAAGTRFVTGQAAAFLPDTRATLESMDRGVRNGIKVLAASGARHPELAKLRTRLEAFDAQTRDPREKVGMAEKLSAADWHALAGQTEALAAEWRKLQFDLNLAGLYPGAAGEPVRAFAVGVLTESDKVYPDSLYQGSLTEPVTLKLAGNEYGSFQLAILPFWTDLTDVKVNVSPLAGTDGRAIGAENLRWYRVGYVKLENLNPRDLNAHPYEPDPLLPAAPFAAPAGKVAAVWVDVKVPAGTPPGAYRGTVTVTASGQAVSRSVNVQVYGFDLPVKSSLENDFWFGLYQWNNFYKPLRYTPELHARHAEILGRYRISSIPCDWITLCPQVPIYHEADGHFTFDWSVLDQYIQNGLKNGSSAFWAALSCNSGWTAWMNNPNVAVTERATGAKTTLGKFIGEKPNYAENPAYRDFLIAYVKHLKELGILDTSYYELFDEPNDNSRWLAMIEHHQFFRKVVPELKLLCYGVEPLQLKAGRSAVGLIDAWAPHMPNMTDEMVNTIKERRAKYGEKFWAYTCGERTDKEGNYSTYCLYQRPYIAVRMNLWFAWYYQVDGYLIFAMSGVPDGNLKADPAQRWPNRDWVDGSYRGCGTFIYPGPDYELIPGMRLANAREGFEDYEFFAALKQASRKLDPARDAKLIAEVTQALTVDPDIISTVFAWTKDRNRLETKREQLAALIAKVRTATGNR